MRPESLKELALCIFIAIGATACAIIYKFDLTNYPKVFGGLAGSTALLTIFFSVRFFIRLKPFERQILKEHWIFEGDEKAYVKILKSEHGKGKCPRVEIFKGDTVYGSKLFDFDILKDGTVEIRNSKGTFVVKSAMGECKIIIRA